MLQSACCTCWGPQAAEEGRSASQGGRKEAGGHQERSRGWMTAAMLEACHGQVTCSATQLPSLPLPEAAGMAPQWQNTPHDSCIYAE